MNDRALRNIVVGLGGKPNGVPREDGFDITVASEIMAIFCLSKDLEDFKERVGKIVVAYTYDGDPVFAKDLKAQGAATLLMKDAIKPNLVQTLETLPLYMVDLCNIAHGCNSVLATNLGLNLLTILLQKLVLGGSRCRPLNIKSRFAELKPEKTVIVATAEL